MLLTPCQYQVGPFGKHFAAIISQLETFQLYDVIFPLVTSRCAAALYKISNFLMVIHHFGRYVTLIAWAQMAFRIFIKKSL